MDGTTAAQRPTAYAIPGCAIPEVTTPAYSSAAHALAGTFRHATCAGAAARVNSSHQDRLPDAARASGRERLLRRVLLA